VPRWLLPENIADVLPAEARRIEELRRALLDLFRAHGYELVMPPLIEHLDALLSGTGRELGLRTFQLIDQLSGRTLGLRADMTPQVARIDAHLLNRQGLARLCYAGSVLHARPADMFASREPIQVGAEIYGHAGLEADLEVIGLMVHALSKAHSGRIRIDLCHVGIVPALLQDQAQESTIAALDQEELYALLQAKDLPALHELLAPVSAPLARALQSLARLYGPVKPGQASGEGDVLFRARQGLPAHPAVLAALDSLERLCASPLWARFPQVELAIDLADLRGYRYHNGITFAAYLPGQPNAMGRGGRYDGAGRVFGRARPATGFSLDLRDLAARLPAAQASLAVCAPWSDDPELARAIDALRASGEIVIQVLPGHEHEQQEFRCDRELIHRNGHWVVVSRPADYTA
jgi:ATP phosphoribosyltransferase regulatory subunit